MKEHMDRAKAEIQEVIERYGLDAFVLLLGGDLAVENRKFGGEDKIFVHGHQYRMRLNTIFDKAAACAESEDSTEHDACLVSSKVILLTNELRETVEMGDKLIKTMNPLTVTIDK